MANTDRTAGAQQATDFTPWLTPSLPKLEKIIVIENDAELEQKIMNRVWDQAVKSPITSDHDHYFWPTKLFEHLFDKETVYVIVRHVFRQSSLTKVHDEISFDHFCREWTCRILGLNGAPAKYRLIFAILVLMQKASSIQNFVDAGFSDEKLPLAQHEIRMYQDQRYGQPNLPFGRWNPLNGDTFYILQCRLFVRYIAQSPSKGEVSHYEFENAHILPWVKISNPVSIFASEGLTTMNLSGGFGEVKQIVIHAWQHGFQESLKKISAAPGCFALKRLYISDKSEFDEEVLQLKRFGGRHDHIVTLLATFSRHTNNGLEYLLLFPWAECDLLDFWKRNTAIKRNHSFFLWTVDQIRGITGALSFIHDPKDEDLRHPNGQPLYGRHGDIKPENILWFKSEGLGKLVLSDLGLTRTHRQESRSNRPGENIPVSPNYRPPECDMEGVKGRISRSFDIWTLGCLILEFMVWVLDGWEGYEKFKERRMSPYITSHDTPIYFEILRVAGEQYAFNIKESVTKEFDRLRGHRSCSQFINDLLTLVQTRLLIVQSEDLKRITSADLLESLKTMERKCEVEAYCLTSISSNVKVPVILPAHARLNEMAKKHIANIPVGDNQTIRGFGGKTRPALGN
ncbi:CMGC protein kinase [Colletotrichum costaricense]|uniref:CMGC protein kinase n=1 Tax=Colletotrichum costaricense TaxID=1209916 RepID=A0AAI9YTZ2_9PEZI|nr:CMGC protein kinase [Colletotrichum costaricense]KAK1522511.1 CMGC protein kinase [Colletotrichum costaricense]